MKYYIGVDLGGTNLRVGLITEHGEFVTIEKRESCVHKGPQFVCGQIVQMIETIFNSFTDGVEGVGMAIPGLLDTKEGLIRFAPNLKWFNVPILNMIQDELKIPVYMDNDCRVHALGEWYYGAGKEFSNFMVIALGTGVGSGIILEDRLYRGASECAGEIGHFIVQENGSQCSCGKFGCLETVASATGITRMAMNLVNSRRGYSILDLVDGNTEAITAKTVFDAWQNGDKEAGRIIDEVIRCLSIAINMFYNTLNLEAVIFSGGVSMAGELLLNPLRQRVREMAEMSLGPYRDMLNYNNIRLAHLGDKAGLAGGAALVRYQMEKMRKN